MNTTRPATVADLPIITQLIRELAEYEKMLDECQTTQTGMHAALFGPHPCAEALVGEIDGVVEGVAIFFTNFSTFVCRPGLYLEDLYVRPPARGKGLGKALLAALARLAVERNYGRMEWVVLDWNAPAIEFYKSLGAVPNDGWTIYRLTGAKLQELGR
jgi:GNAT superfamily N-acetyltransferase